MKSSKPFWAIRGPPSPQEQGQTHFQKVSCLSVLQFPFTYLWVFKQGHTASPCPCNCPHACTNTPGWSPLQLKRSWLCKTAAVPPGICQTYATHKWPCKDRCIFMTGTAAPSLVAFQARIHYGQVLPHALRPTSLLLRDHPVLSPPGSS